MTKAEALRQAMLTLLKGGRFKTPYFWAGFVVVGDGS
jgi:CHAT domain-containing protein